VVSISINPKNAFVSEEELPPFTVFKDGTFGYRLRYRIISEDGNRFSHYSPIETVKANYSFERPNGKLINNFAIVRQGPYVNVIWDPVSIINNDSDLLVKKANQYDLWIRWTQGESNGVYQSIDRVDGTIQGFIVPSSYSLLVSGVQTVVNEEPTRLSVEIYIRSTSPSRNSSALLVYKLDNFNIEPPASPPSN
jgi:hypothetical protein